MSIINPNTIQTYLLKNFQDIYLIDTWGEKSFFYNPGKKKKRGFYFITIKKKDGPNDQASNLDRDGIYRLNLGITEKSFINLFSMIPSRPAKGKSINGSCDFTQLNILTPHPVYGWMKWVSILNPDPVSFELIKALLEEKYKILVNTSEEQ
jgi:hypothetical protein